MITGNFLEGVSEVEWTEDELWVKVTFSDPGTVKMSVLCLVAVYLFTKAGEDDAEKFQKVSERKKSKGERG